MVTQKEAEAMMALIYTPEKRREFKIEMDKAGVRWEDESDTGFGFDEYMQFRKDLRKRLGYPN